MLLLTEMMLKHSMTETDLCGSCQIKLDTQTSGRYTDIKFLVVVALSVHDHMPTAEWIKQERLYIDANKIKLQLNLTKTFRNNKDYII